MQANPTKRPGGGAGVRRAFFQRKQERRAGWRLPFRARKGRGRTGYSFSFTPEGLAMLAVVFLVGFAAWHSGTNLLYLIFSTLIAFYLINGFILWNNLRGVIVRREAPHTVQAGAPFHIGITLTNSKAFFPSTGLVVSSIGKGFTGGRPLFFDRLSAGETVALEASGQFANRGIHTLETLAVVSRYPFGFEQRGVVFPVRNELLVVPPTYNVRALVSDMPAGYGDQESSDKGAGTDLYGLREYVPGEHARHVHWKSSAKSGKLMIAEYHRDERRQILVVLDNSLQFQPTPLLSDTFEKAVILAASLARHFIEEGYEVGVSTASGTVGHGNGRAHLDTILRALATLQLTSEIIEPVSWDPRIPAIELVYGKPPREKKPGSNGTETMDARNWQITDGRFTKVATP